MIAVTRLNGSQFWINPDLIQTVEANPDTVITLTNEEKWVVSETPEVLIERVIVFRRQTWPQPTAL
jgi:flagellar protein FlbD